MFKGLEFFWLLAFLPGLIVKAYYETVEDAGA